MNMEMLIALGSCVLSFLAFRLFFYFINKNLSVEIPDLISFIAGIITIVVLYTKRDFFFAGNPIVTGVSLGVPLAVFWSITGEGLMGEVLEVVLSLRFMVWCLAVVGGNYWDVWSSYAAAGTPQAKTAILFVAVILFVLGTVLMLLPEFCIKNIIKSNGFTLNRSASTPKKIITQITGLIIIFICSGMLSEIILLINKLFS